MCTFLQRNLSACFHLRMENASLGAPLNSGGPLPLMCLGSAVPVEAEREGETLFHDTLLPSIK